MESDEIGEGVEALLGELHEQKRWLDMMIKGLEAALESPEHQLIELVERTFAEDEMEAPTVDYSGKSALASLARSVGKSPQARRMRSQRGLQAVKT
jgi:hypothetical protein